MMRELSTGTSFSNDRATAGAVIRLLKRVDIRPLSILVPLVLSLSAAAFEGVGMGLLVPLLQGFLTTDYSFMKEVPGLQALIVLFPESVGSRDRSLFLLLIGLFVSATILKNALRYGAGLSMSSLGSRALHRLRALLFARYLSFGKLYFDRTNVGHHSTVLSEYTRFALSPLLAIDKHLSALFSLIVYVVVMFVISWKLTLFALPLFLLLHVAIRGMIVRMRSFSKRIAENASALGKKTVEILSTIPLVKTSGTEELEQRRYGGISAERAALEFRQSAVQKLIHPFQEVITLFAILLLFSGMLYLLLRAEGAAVSSFIVYFYLVLSAANKFGAVTGFRATMADSSGYIAGVMEVLDDAHKHIIPSGSRECPPLRDAIEFRNLRFTFPNGNEAIKGLTLRIEKGRMTALVGPTGAGKTTIINILLRMYDCPERSVFFDGTDIREFSISSLLQHIALVSQDALLLHDSVRNNIAYGLSGVTDTELRRAVAQARLTTFVDNLPHGLDTLIGDRGVRLSGGEKQRVAIARALLRNAGILVLDEATSSLDSETERLIQEAIDCAVAGRTTIVIAHRLSTIRNADNILVIEDGRCREEGKLDELLARKGKFHALWEAQKFS